MADEFTKQTEENLAYIDSILDMEEEEDISSTEEDLDFMIDTEEVLNDLTGVEDQTSEISELEDVNNILNDITGEDIKFEPPVETNKEQVTNISNAIKEGMNEAVYDFFHQGDYAKTFASATYQGVRGLMPFVDATPEDVYFTQPYEPIGINTEGDQFAKEVSRTVVEMAGQIAATVGGGVAGSFAPVVGNVAGATIGTVGSSAALANSMFGKSLYQNYNQYLQEGRDENDALIRAIEDAYIEAGIEFGTDIAGAGVAKLAKLGVSSGKVAKAAANLVKSGGIRIGEAGLEITEAGAKTLSKDVKKLLLQTTPEKTNILKETGKAIVKGAALEGVVEEGGQQTYSVIRHRKDNQSPWEAIVENKEEIGKAVAMGAAAGGVAVGATHLISKGVSSVMDYASTKMEDRAFQKYLKVREKEKDTQAALSSVVQENNLLLRENKVAPIGDSYGVEVTGNQEVNAQGETVLTTKPVDTEEDTAFENIDEELITQNDGNEEVFETQESKVDLSETRNELAEVNGIDNNETENTIPGSVSDNGYASSEDHPVDVNGLSSEDEVPSTPQTDKDQIDTHNKETEDAIKALGLKKENLGKAPEQPENRGNREVTNGDVSSIHKYYGVKNFVEAVGSAITDRAGKAYNLFVKGELSTKEKRLSKLGRLVRGYTQPAVNNVIRISNSRDYPTILHETAHHLVAKMKLLQNELKTNAALIKEEHKKLEKLNPSYTLNEDAYKKKGQDITEEYFSDLLAAYGTDTYTPDSKITQLINQGMEQVGVTKQFNTMRQQFADFNTIKEGKGGALQIAQNNMRAARLLARKKFDTKNLNNKQLKTITKFMNGVKDTPRVLVEKLINENYQIEKDAKRTDKYRDVLKANQALRASNRIAGSFIYGTGTYFNNGNLRKLSGKRGIKGLAKIYRETEALGEGYVDKVESLLWAKQTIGESTGNQAKADNLLTLAKDLGYSNWNEARKDLKLLSLLYQKNLYQGTQITQSDISKGVQLQNIERAAYIPEEDTEALSKRTDLLSVDFNDSNLITRLNNLIDYIQNKAVQNTQQKDLKNDFIRDNYLLDKAGAVNTAMSLDEALRIYTTLQSDPKIQQIEAAEQDVRSLLQTVEDLMTDSSVSSKMQIEFAKQSTGAWYVPLLRFIDVDEEKAIGINLKGNSFNKRYGSNREVRDIFTSIENTIQAVANNVTQNQAVDYVLSLKNEPIFAQYIREVPANSKEVSANLLDIVTNKIAYIDTRLKDAEVRGEELLEKDALLRMKSNLEVIKNDIKKGNVTSDDARVELFVETPPKNSNIIQRMEADGKVHYYLLDDVLKNFLYNQRKNIFDVINQSQFAKDHLGWIQKSNNILQYIPRFTYTISNISFQVANISRDAMDAAYKGSQNNTFTDGMLLLPRYVNNMRKSIQLIGSLCSAKNREEFDTLTTIFGGAEQTQYREGDYTTSYLDYKLNKKGKIVRGGKLGWINTLADVLGNADLITRMVAVENKCKELGLDIHEANATYDDYVSLNLPKKYLKKYITDEQIETVLGKDKANAWRETSDNEYFPYVPEEFEKADLNNIFKKHEQEISNKFNPEIMSMLQDIYDTSSIDFTKGTMSSRTLGKLFLFANARIQGAAQAISYSANNKKAFTGAFSEMMMLGILQSVLGWEDDNPSDDTSGFTGFEIKPLGIRFPIQSIMLLPKVIGNAIGRQLVDKDNSSRSLAKDLTGILWDNSLGAFQEPSGLVNLFLGAPLFLAEGKLPNFVGDAQYNEFNYYRVTKAGANVDTLTKKMDSTASRLLSKWLVDNGIYKYSAHEIDRFMGLIFGNAEKQLEGVLGLGGIFDDKTNKIDWLKYKWNPIGDLLDSMYKPLTIKNFPMSEDVKYINDIRTYSLSLYDRYTGQTNIAAESRITPDMLSQEDRNKYQKYYDRSFFAWKAQENLGKFYATIPQIDREKEGGEKAYNDLVDRYKRLARTYRKFIEDYDGDGGDTPRGYKKYYPIFDEELANMDRAAQSVIRLNEAAPENKGILRTIWENTLGTPDANSQELTASDLQNTTTNSTEINYTKYRHPATVLMENRSSDSDYGSISNKNRYGPNHLLGEEMTRFVSSLEYEYPEEFSEFTTSNKIAPNITKYKPGTKNFSEAYKLLAKQDWFPTAYQNYVNYIFDKPDRIPEQLQNNDAVRELAYSIRNHAGKNTSLLAEIEEPSSDARTYIRQVIDKADVWPRIKSATTRHKEELYLYGKYAKELTKDPNTDFMSIITKYEEQRRADSTNPLKKKVDGEYVWKTKDEIEALAWED